MARFLIIAVLPLVVGCNVQTKSPESGDEAVSIRADDSGQIAFDLPVVEGQLKLPAGMMRNGDIDIDGVKLMPGSSITGFSVDAAHDGATVKLPFTSPETPDEVRSYYVGKFKEKGVDASVSGNAITGVTRDGAAFAILVSPAGNGSKGEINIKSKA